MNSFEYYLHTSEGNVQVPCKLMLVILYYDVADFLQVANTTRY